MKLDWNKKEISSQEAIGILDHANECMEYVSKMLPNNLRPIFTWGSVLTSTMTLVVSLRDSLKYLSPCEHGPGWPCRLRGSVHAKCDYTGMVTPNTRIIR